ncbi:MAG: hypothetical protein GX046_02475 [Tissierellia bacterium]|nr:hypothetical protein [Tissierellia bacterium]
MMQGHTLYILLSNTGSFASKCIGLYTRRPYSHVSIALDVNLEEIYSFARLKPSNPLIGGFVREDIDNGTFSLFPDTTCELYSITISNKQYDQFIHEINRFIDSEHKYGYNFLGVMGLVLNSPINRKYNYFCSQFVAEVLHNSDIRIIDKDAGLTTPNDFRNNENLHLIYEGSLKQYERHIPAFSY